VDISVETQASSASESVMLSWSIDGPILYIGDPVNKPVLRRRPKATHSRRAMRAFLRVVGGCPGA